jgi:hypothetical protein
VPDAARIPSVQAIWLVEPGEPLVTVWARTGDGWNSSTYARTDSHVPALGGSVALRDVYATTLT